MEDLYDLQHFAAAQEPVFTQVIAELNAAHKSSHWMWFIFPQFEGLGSSTMARRFAIRSLSEAEAYSRHAVLGPRLRECTAIVNAIEGVTARSIFGSPDDLKFRSSMTLFSQVETDTGLFRTALDKYFGGEPDPLTLARLK